MRFQSIFLIRTKSFKYLLSVFIIITINEIFIQDLHFSVMYIAINIYPVKINNYNLINKHLKLQSVKMFLYLFFKYQEAISLTTLDRQVIVDFNAQRPKARLGNL